LRRITVTHTHNATGVEHESRVEMQVTQVKRTPIAAAEFVIPKKYKEVPNKRLFEDSNE
jgi:hypothetical protein